MKTSPWGKVDHETIILAGMTAVSTPGHGGILVSADRQRLIPEYMRETWCGVRGAYEEDCEWSIPFVVFEAEIAEDGDAHSKKIIAEGTHRQTFKGWYPDHYERFYGVVLAPGESRTKDEREWRRAHADAIQGVSGFGDWQRGVPVGMVGVVACVGGRRDNGQYGGKERYFLVPKAEYGTRTENPCGTFVIDPAKHREVGDFTKLGSKDAEEMAAMEVTR